MTYRTGDETSKLATPAGTAQRWMGSHNGNLFRIAGEHEGWHAARHAAAVQTGLEPDQLTIEQGDMRKMKVIYVAGRFRGKTAWHVAENVRAAERVGMQVAELGHMPLIPHANTANFDGTLDDKFWIDGTLELLKRCDGIVMVPGWETSVGAKGERAYAIENDMPVFDTVEALAELGT